MNKETLRRAAALMRDAAESIRLARMVGIQEGLFMEEEGDQDMELVQDLCTYSTELEKLIPS